MRQLLRAFKFNQISLSSLSIFAGLLSLILSACGGQNSGFQSSANSYCSTSNCNGAVQAASADVFISSQGLTISKKISFTPGTIFFGVLPQEVAISGTCTVGAGNYHNIQFSFWPQANPAQVTVFPSAVKCENGRFNLAFNPNIQTATTTRTQIVYGIKASLLTGANQATATEAAAFQSIVTIEQ